MKDKFVSLIIGQLKFFQMIRIIIYIIPNGMLSEDLFYAQFNLLM